MKTCPSVLGILGISSLPHPFSMLVSNSSSVLSWALRVAHRAIGFMTKIKKLLETVCHNCGKILVDEVSHPSRGDRSSLYMQS